MARIAVLSDIHFGKLSRSDFFATPGEKLIGFSSGDIPLGEGLIKLMKDMKPDYMFIPGDLTSAAEPQEFLYCEKRLLSIADEVGIDRSNIIVCLGNHDVDWGISNLSDLQSRTFNNTKEILEYRRDKYQHIASHVAGIYMNEILMNKSEGNPAPYGGLREEEDFIVFVLNTGWKCSPLQEFSHGELTKNQLDWLSEKLDYYMEDNRKKIILMHHHPFNYPYPVVGKDITQIVEGADFSEIVENKGVDLVIHGHRHHPKLKTQLPSGRNPITYFCAGSVSVNSQQRYDGNIPNTMHFIDVDRNLDYFVFHNFSYTATKGWHKTINDVNTPLDDKMKVGKVFSSDECCDSIKKYLRLRKKYIKLEWESLDESLQFMTYNAVMELIKKELSDKYHITGCFPDTVALVKKGVK